MSFTRHFLIRFSNTVCFARTRLRMASAPLKAYCRDRWYSGADERAIHYFRIRWQTGMTGLGTLLKRIGYQSVFFMVGRTGRPMGFDHFVKAAGYDRYFGRKNTAMTRILDGNWGIYDGPFLQKEPFMRWIN